MKATNLLRHSAAIVALLIGSAALADTNLPVVCSNAAVAGQPVNNCATTAQSFARATPTSLVRVCSSATCTFAERTWRAFGQVAANQFVEVCSVDMAIGAPIGGGNCSATNAANDWAAMRMIAPSSVASSSSGTFTVTPSEGVAPLSVTIAWNVAGATSCTAGGSWSGAKAASGSQAVTNLTANATYSLVCSRTTTTTTGSATLRWTNPTENTDGTPLTNLAGTRIYHGTTATTLSTTIQVSSPTATTYIVEDLPVGPRFFALKSYTSSGAESSLSNIASKTIAGSSSTVEIFNESRTVTVRPPSVPNPPILTIDTVAYRLNQNWNAWTKTRVGTVALGLPCRNGAGQGTNDGYFVLSDRMKVTLDANQSRPNAPLVKCAPPQQVAEVLSVE